jgi:hypothetical protein
MQTHEKQDELRLGFLAAARISEQGYIGGLLVTNGYGRPLEFQCTAPVTPNRTQQILYGPTLVPFILGELIGRTLIERVDVRPQLVLIEQPEILDVRPHVRVPVACLVDEPEIIATAKLPQVGDSPANAEELFKQETGGSERAECMAINGRKLRFHSAHTSDRNVIATKRNLIPQDADLKEPFERVREALNETVRSGAAQ